MAGRDHARPASSLKRRSKSPLSTPQTDAKKAKLTRGNGNPTAVCEPRKAIWELTPDEVNKMFGGGVDKAAAEIESSPEMLSDSDEVAGSREGRPRKEQQRFAGVPLLPRLRQNVYVRGFCFWQS